MGAKGEKSQVKPHQWLQHTQVLQFVAAQVEVRETGQFVCQNL